MMECDLINFTLKQLRYIEATGRLGSISNAAAEQNISQSSITAAIDALESQIGYDLFMRTPAKGISVTPSGAETLRLIRGFIDQSRHFEAEMESVGGDAKGSVRIACYGTAAPSFLPQILKDFTKTYPGISIKLLEGDMLETVAYLRNGEADLAFTYIEAVDDKLKFSPLFKAPPYALLPADDPLAEAPFVSFAQLAEKPMVILDLPRTKSYFLAMFEQKGLTPNIVHSTRSAEITRALVAGGYGYSILNICPPDYRQDDRRFRVVPIKDDIRVPVFGIATLAGNRQPRMVSAFIENCAKLKEIGVFEEIVVT